MKFEDKIREAITSTRYFYDKDDAVNYGAKKIMEIIINDFGPIKEEVIKER